jgi:hypothetical protein
MILQTSTSPIEVNGDTSSQSFSIAMNGKAFKVLSDTLYQDKIGSIIREVCSNAYDAHVAAGNKEEPFEIHLPDQFEPWFSVKDFGIGLSDEAVRTVFTRYFESTKGDSNDSIGCFGLGAKTPFSYTDQFSVSSVYNNVRTEYSAYLTPSGVPALSEMYKAHTDERNGVEIKLSVKREDYRQFSDKAEQQLRFFKVKPIVKNAPFSFKFDEKFDAKAFVELEGFKAVSGHGAYIVQGNVGYELNAYRVLEHCTDEKLEAFIRRLYNITSFYIEFPIGSIGVTASREAVEYNDATVAAILQRFSTIHKELEANMLEQQKLAANNWEIAVNANRRDLFNNKEAYAQAFNDLHQKPSLFRGNYSFKIDTLKGYKAESTVGRRVYTLDEIQPSESMLIAIKDKCSYAKQRIDVLASKSSYLIVITLGENQTVEDLSNMLGGYSDFVMVSSAAYSPAVKTSVKSSKTSCWGFKGRSLREWKKLEALDDSKEFAYIVIDNLQYTDKRDELYVETYTRLNDTDFKLPPLFAIRASDVKKLNGNAVALSTWIENKKVELQPEFSKTIKRNDWFNALDIAVHGELRTAILNSDFKLATLLKLKDKIADKINYDKIRIAKIFNFESSSTKFEQMIADSLQREISRHPILKLDKWIINREFSPEEIKQLLSVQVN